jgi:hypothetical protein
MAARALSAAQAIDATLDDVQEWPMVSGRGFRV